MKRFERTDLKDTVFDHVISIQLDHKKQAYTIIMSETYTNDVKDWQIANKKPRFVGKGNLHLDYEINNNDYIGEHLIKNIQLILSRPAYPMAEEIPLTFDLDGLSN